MSIYSIDILSDVYEVIFIDFEFLTDDNSYGKSNVYEFGDSNIIENKFLSINKAWGSKKYGYKSECLSILYDIYATAIRHKLQTYMPKCKYSLLQSVIDIISTDFLNPDFSVNSLANRVGISESYLRSLFKSVYSTSPIKYVIGLRIKTAKELLKYTDEPISVIAEKSGFNDLFYFSKIFKKTTSYTPSRYRKIFNK